MPNDRDPITQSIAFDEAIRRMERQPPYRSHVQDVADRALRLLDAMHRAGFSQAEISEFFKTRVLLVGSPEVREAVAGGCARAMTIRYRMGGNAGSPANAEEPGAAS
jgi:hypothetical protein